MRQQHDLDNPRHEDFSNTPPTPVPAPRPAARSTGSPPLADLAGLTHLLVAPIPIERALASAVEHAAQLVSNARRLTLFALDPTAPGRLVQLASAERERAGELPRLSVEPVAADTLGYGERADRQVLVERSVARPAGAALLPVSAAHDVLLGALVVEMAPAAARPDAPLLGLIANTLGALLERRDAAEEQQRASRALAALPALSFAPAGDATGWQGTVPASAVAAEAEGRAAEEEVAALLAAGARELRALTAVRDCIPLVCMPSGAWTTLPGAILPGDIGITPAQADALLPALREGSVSVTPDQNDMLWSELGPLRQRAGYPIARVHLIAAATPRETFAIYALAESVTTPPVPRWLPLARALATAIASGIAARRLTAEVRDEARARDAYMSLAAHELRSPMTAIKGYAQLLIRQTRKQPLPEPMMRSVEAIEQQSLRLAEMLGELLDASRLRRGTLLLTPRPVDLGEVLPPVVEHRQAMFPQHAITLDLPEHTLTVTGEAARVEQVLRDLIDNAARHTPGSGTIAVSVTTPQSGEALIAVRDSGIGVAPEDRERIFDYLYRAPRSEERNLSGLGLGLYVSRHLVERMGGRLWLEASSTEPPSGSDFRFTLALA